MHTMCIESQHAVYTAATALQLLLFEEVAAA
jgi:hypothetical protein